MFAQDAAWSRRWNSGPTLGACRTIPGALADGHRENAGPSDHLRRARNGWNRSTKIIAPAILEKPSRPSSDIDDAIEELGTTRSATTCLRLIFISCQPGPANNRPGVALTVAPAPAGSLTTDEIARAFPGRTNRPSPRLGSWRGQKRTLAEKQGGRSRYPFGPELAERAGLRARSDLPGLQTRA